MPSSAAREIIRDLPYFLSASRSQVIGAEDDATMTQYEMPMEEQIKKLDAMNEGLDAKFDQVITRIDETNAIFKRQLKVIQGIRDSMDEKFEAAEKASAERTELLKSLLGDVQRLEVLERPKPRRRRS